ncbi:MAG: hypothetical protein JWN14_1629, partial [Chthonomonadales bacterium]|nr:hypothetical protein [Chthonomonadales bacterium]
MVRKTTTHTSTGNPPSKVFVDTGGWYGLMSA